MDERLRLVRDALSDRCTMSERRARYGVSPRIGYKWLARYDTEGRPGLRDRSRASRHCPHKMPNGLIELLMAERTAHPHWGARKLLTVLADRHPRIHRWPAPSPVADLPARRGLVQRRGRARGRTRRPHPRCAPARQARSIRDLTVTDVAGLPDARLRPFRMSSARS